MFLVLPSVYDKVLKSIDEKDKKVLEQVNIEKETEVRPAEKYFENVANVELQENDPQPSTSEFIDPESTNQPEQTFGQTEVIQPNEMIENPTPEPESREIINPLKTECAQPDFQDQFVPIIQPGLKRKKILKPALGKITKPIIIPSIIKKQPQIERIQNIEMMQPDITQIKQKGVVSKNFVCNICLKRFKSNYHLNRHIQSVHKNLIQRSDPSLPENITLPDDDILMANQPVVQQPSTSHFQNWQTDPQPQTKGQKRTQTQAKLKNTQRPTKMRPSTEEFDEWK
jgi:hypothetical protein